MSLKINDLTNELKEKYLKEWWDTSLEFPQFKKSYSTKQQKAKERDLSKIISRLDTEIRQFHTNVYNEYKTWSQRVKSLLKSAGCDILEMPAEHIDILMDNGFFQATYEITDKAHKFDPLIKFEEIFQALRNVWIMNGIQLLMGHDIKYTPSIFAYSMLYPYTDNYLDSPEIPISQKKEISKEFRAKIEGKQVKAKNQYEKILFNLIDIICEQYPYNSNVHVYENLLGIHDAQQKSLMQHTRVSSPYEADILGISFEKGGTSVMADAWLVNGELSEAQTAFMYGFGIILQLIDDAQDAEEDIKNGHMTIFSQTAGKWPLDAVTNRLINFIYDLLDSDICFNSPEMKQFKELIKESCSIIIVSCIAHNSAMYSRDYIRMIEKHSPLSFKYMRNVEKVIQKKFTNLMKIKSERPIDIIITEALAQT